MRVYYDRDADLNLIKSKKVAIIGYGSQGRAHALNLKDSGAQNLVVALKAGSPTIKKAEADGLKVMTVAEAAAWADLMMMATPVELPADIYKADRSEGPWPYGSRRIPEGRRRSLPRRYPPQRFGQRP